MPDAPLTNAQLHLSRKKSSDSKPPSCSERPLTLFHTMQSTEQRECHYSGPAWSPGDIQASSQLPGVLTSSLSVCVAAFYVLEDTVSAIVPSRVPWLSNLDRTGSRGAEDEREGHAAQDPLSQSPVGRQLSPFSSSCTIRSKLRRRLFGPSFVSGSPRTSFPSFSRVVTRCLFVRVTRPTAVGLSLHRGLVWLARPSPPPLLGLTHGGCLVNVWN